MKVSTEDEHLPLRITQKARHRVIVGLRWDPRNDLNLRERIARLLRLPVPQYDMDLSCHIYDADGVLIDCVTTEPGKSINQSGHIYHSGDDQDGAGGYDDEQISIEFKDLPDTIHHLIFSASVKSHHWFGEIRAPEIRLADGYKDEDIIRVPLGMGADADKSRYIFTRLYKKGSDWFIHNIGHYPDPTQPADLESHLSSIIQAQSRFYD